MNDVPGTDVPNLVTAYAGRRRMFPYEMSKSVSASRGQFSRGRAKVI